MCEDLIEAAQDFMDLTTFVLNEKGKEEIVTVGNCFTVMRQTRGG